MTAAVELYAAGLHGGDGPLVLHEQGGGSRVLPVATWTADDVPGDAGLLDRCTGASLDVGCGPGRLTVALGRRGLPALGVDIAPGAVRLARARGALVLTRSVFSRLPGSGRWQSVLLADGNVGIGGDPTALLHRLAALLAPGGRVLAEVDRPGSTSRCVQVRVEHAGRTSDWFPWAHVAAQDAGALAAAAGLQLTEQWEEAGRWFVAMAKP